MSRDSKKSVSNRLQVADDVIGMMRATNYTNIKHFVFGARLDVRTVVDPEPFELSGDPRETEKQLIEASLPRVYVTTSLENGSPYFRVYGCGDVLTLNDNLYGHCIAAVINATYAAVGLTTPGGEADQELVDKIRGEN